MKKTLGCMVVLVFLASAAQAANIDTYGIGSKATALGGAFTAYADDVYAPYYNPAGLVQIGSPRMSAGIMVLDPDLEAKNFRVVDPATNTTLLGPTNANDESSNLYVPHLGFAMPVSDQLALGVAAYAPFGIELEWEKNPAKNPAAYNAFQYNIDRAVVTPSIAYEFNDKWALGFGVSLGRATNGAKLWSYELEALGMGAAGIPITAYEDVDMDDDFNWSYNIGVMFKPIDTVSIGATYRSRTSTDFEGDLSFAGLDATEITLLNTLIDTGSGGTLTGLTKTKFDVSMDDLDFPEQLQAGVRYAPHDRISMEVDVVWTNWSIIDDEVLNIDDPELRGALAALARVADPTSTETGERIISARDWNDTVQLKFGIEWKATDMIAVRGGYFYDPTPIPDDTFDVIWADADKKTYSVGFGLDLDPWFVDGVFQYTKVEQERIIGGESENLNETYLGYPVSLKADGEVFGYGLTVGYVF